MNIPKITRKLNVRIAAFLLPPTTSYLLPTVSLAHGGVDDGHVEEVVTTVAPSGASALLKAFTPEWWGLLVVSILITALLSYLMWRFLQVAPYKKSETAQPKPETLVAPESH